MNTEDLDCIIQVAKFAIENGFISAHVISNKFLIGYMRACGILEQLEIIGVVDRNKDGGYFVCCESEEELYDLINKLNCTSSTDENISFDNYYELQKIENLAKYEYPRREKIYQESLNIIQNTNNLGTFLGRITDINNYIDWLSKNFDTSILSKYIILSIDGEKIKPEIFWEEMNCMINDNLVRIVSYNYSSTKDEILVLKQKKAKESRVIKLYELVEKAKHSIFKAKNSEETMTRLEEIHLSVDELYNEL